MLLGLLRLLSALGIDVLREHSALEVIAGDRTMVCGDEQNVTLRVDVFENEGVGRPLVSVNAWAHSSFLILRNRLERHVAIIALPLVVVDDDEVLVLRHRDQVFAPGGQRGDATLVLFRSPPHDLLALHIELFDRSRNGSKRHDIWILLHDAHGC